MSDFEVRDAQIEQTLKDVGRTVAGTLPEGWGFTLFIFTFGEGGSMFYTSNAKRGDMLRAMREFMYRQRSSDQS